MEYREGREKEGEDEDGRTEDVLQLKRERGLSGTRGSALVPGLRKSSGRVAKLAGRDSFDGTQENFLPGSVSGSSRRC